MCIRDRNFYAWLSDGWAVAPVFGPAQAVPAVSESRFTLSSLAVIEPGDDQPGSVDIAMIVDAGGQGGGAVPAPTIVSFTFPVDGLISA